MHSLIHNHLSQTSQLLSLKSRIHNKILACNPPFSTRPNKHITKMHRSILVTGALAAMASVAGAAAITNVAVNTVYTTTIVSGSTTTFPTSDCGPFQTVAPDYSSCSAGCSLMQVPGAFEPPTPSSPWVCSDPVSVSVSYTTTVSESTCSAGSTVALVTPAYGAVWSKCTATA